MGNVLELNAANWEREVLQSNVLTVVDFWHEHCSWCIQLNPIYEEMAEEHEGKIKFTKLNVLQNPDNREIAIRYGIMGTPTLAFFCAGRPLELFVGVSKERLKNRLNEMLGQHKECVQQSTVLKN